MLKKSNTATEEISTAKTSRAISGWLVGFLTAVIALTANTAAWFLARGLGADMLVRRNTTEPAMTIGIPMIASMTLAPILAATVLLLVLRRRSVRLWRHLGTLGLVVALVTVPAPFTVLASTSTQVALASMHVLTGLAWFFVVRRVVRHRAVG